MTDAPKPRSQGMFQPRVTARPRPLMEDLHRPGAAQAAPARLAALPHPDADVVED